ncbi:MAG: hypothetical protein HC897_10645 [Thermoanaerobaculia bacterium]|nr:hypothetical protein [Thermoanaerobaculia bacterium]
MKTPRRKQDQINLRHLLTDLGYGQAEMEGYEAFKQRFYPVANHVRAFEPDVVLVVGERGTGKSALFRAVFENDLLAAIARHAPLAPRLPQQPEWVQAYPLHAGFPDALGLRRFLASPRPDEAVELWLAYLVRTLENHLTDAATESVQRIWAPQGAALEAIIAALRDARDEPLLALDRLDQKLQENDQWLFVGYDELDTLGGYDWQTMHQALRGLIGFWAGYSRRWRRLRAKLFVRTDLFHRHADFGGADLAKLAANRVDLTWSDRNLFAMLIKRIANTDPALLAYCRGGEIDFKLDADLGQIPLLQESEDARKLIERMLGLFMGANRSKGRTFYWVLDHLRDGRSHVVPRNLVRLFERAAGKEQANFKAKLPQLLHPTALSQALADVSVDHVRQASSHEWPWLHGVEKRMQQNRLMPLERKELEAVLENGWETSWANEADVRPPVDSAEELIDYLLELGVFKERVNNRIDVPDIYLFGLGLRRKGGVQRRG